MGKEGDLAMDRITGYGTSDKGRCINMTSKRNELHVKVRFATKRENRLLYYLDEMRFGDASEKEGCGNEYHGHRGEGSVEGGFAYSVSWRRKGKLGMRITDSQRVQVRG